jgi:S-DNA-T family DNA segregation ATPase FtsK/SpoIIIE
VLVALYAVMVLFTYSKDDPGWSHSTGSGEIHNAGGRFGAWVADLLLYSFGMSAYWSVVFLCSLSIGATGGLESTDRRSGARFLAACTGFTCCCSRARALEALRAAFLQVRVAARAGGMIASQMSEVAGALVRLHRRKTLSLLFMGPRPQPLERLSWLEVQRSDRHGLERAGGSPWRGVAAARDRKAVRRRPILREEVVEEEKRSSTSTVRSRSCRPR